MRARDLISLFAKRYPQAEFPSSFLAYVQGQDAIGHPIRRAGTRQPLVSFLQDLEVAPELIFAFLDSDSRIVCKASFPELLSKPPEEADGFLADRFAGVFALQEIVLDSETLSGFNRHGREHLRTVTRRMLSLLRTVHPQALSREVETEAVIAGYVHDVGNLLSRKDHGVYGIYLVTQLFTGVDRDPQTLDAFLRVLEAVLFHEVEFGSRFSSLAQLSPVTLSLVVADKTDVSFRRVSDKSNASEAIRDAHMLVNLLTASSRIQCKRKSFQWEIHFSPTIQDEEAARFSALLKKAERVWVPDEWQRLYRKDNIEYVFIFHATFLRIYLSRLAFAVRATFALSPSIETFCLVVNDDERGVSLSRCFNREDYQAKLSLIYNNLFKNAPEEPGPARA